MFILIPIIIIFFLGAYLYMNETSIYTQAFIYSLMLLTIYISVYIYNSIKKNIHQQELNIIQLEINELLQKLSNSSDEQYIKSLKYKIEELQKEKASKKLK